MKEDFSDSTFFQLLTSEQVEIDKLKWVESEKSNRDIGKNYAIVLWVRYYRQGWIEKL